MFVGGFGEANEQDIEQIFILNNLHPVRIRILTDEITGRAKGAAFVDFDNPSSAQEACQLDGREVSPSRRSIIHVRPADRRGDNRGGGDYRGRAGGGERDQVNSVFVGGLGEVTEQEVRQIFALLNLHPIRIRLLRDETGRSKGVAFLDFDNPLSAQEACQLDGREVGPSRRRIRVNPAAGGVQRGGRGRG